MTEKKPFPLNEDFAGLLELLQLPQANSESVSRKEVTEAGQALHSMAADDMQGLIQAAERHASLALAFLEKIRRLETDEFDEKTPSFVAKLLALDKIHECANESDGTAPHDDMRSIEDILNRAGYQMTPFI
jgi:uncharacterized membrane protein YccC